MLGSLENCTQSLYPKRRQWEGTRLNSPTALAFNSNVMELAVADRGFHLVGVVDHWCGSHQHMQVEALLSNLKNTDTKKPLRETRQCRVVLVTFHFTIRDVLLS